MAGRYPGAAFLAALSSKMGRRGTILSLVGAVIGVATVLATRALPAVDQRSLVFLVVATGAGGGVLASLGSGWTARRMIDGAFRGLFPAVLLLMMVRGLLLRPPVRPVNDPPGGIVTFCFLIALGRAPRHAAPSPANRLGRSAAAAALVILSAHGGWSACR